MGLDPSGSKKNHCQRVLDLRREFSGRYMRYLSRPQLALPLRKLMLLDPSTDNSLSEEELDELDKALKPIRELKRRHYQVFLKR